MNSINFYIEEELADKGFSYIIGVDECARGNLAGPVIAAAVKINVKHLDYLLENVNDSKKLSGKKRAQLAEFIKDHCLFSLGYASPEEIDTMNILEATKLAIKRATQQHTETDYALIDGNMCFDGLLDIPYISIVKGDASSLSIAAASIVAKEAQVGYMMELDKKYPLYGFKSHKGYGTKKHCDAIIRYGVLPVHRKTFKRVREYVR